MKWISIKDKLPPLESYILTSLNGDIKILIYTDDNLDVRSRARKKEKYPVLPIWRNVTCCETEQLEPDYWMQLPEIPKK